MKRVGERDRRRVAVVRVIGLDPVGGHLDLVIALADDDRPKPVEVKRLPEDLLDRFRCCVRRDVPVVRIDPAQGVANRPPDDVGVVPRRDEAYDDALDVGGYLDLRNGASHPRSLESGADHIPR